MFSWAVLLRSTTKCHKLFVSNNKAFLQRCGFKSDVIQIDKIVIANRGEIACRIIRTARKLGVKTVAIFSDADENAMHVAMADEAYRIGPPPANQSYLCGDKVIEIAKRSGSQAIHPGYGFLSENAEFSEICHKVGVTFIGPPASAIKNMGIKSTSKIIMSDAGVPIIKGYHGSDQSVKKLKEEASKIGYPIMIKAVRGGGGKGMRIAHSEKDFEEALQSARTESEKSFGDSDVLLERFVSEPRHVEVQIFADTHGNAVHLFERDCSVQRRHQKIIEEAPAPGLANDLRNKLGSAAVRAAKAVGYVGAGTVEFILDRTTHDFFFMEMNTRLQVEHPVTEMITGYDLVEWQIKIAAGEKLPVEQENINFKGHAFEARIYAEDPKGGFLPGAGPLLYLSTPEPAKDVRIETGVQEGDEVSIYYDPMIAKLVVWAKERTVALNKLRTNLLNYNISGVETNINFLLTLTKHPEFTKGNVHTNFIHDHNKDLFPEVKPSQNQLIQAALAVILSEKHKENTEAIRQNNQFNPFIVESGFRVNYLHKRTIKLIFNNEEYELVIQYLGKNDYNVSLDKGNSWIKVGGSLIKENNVSTLDFFIEDYRGSTKFYLNDEHIALFDLGGKIQFNFENKQFWIDENESGSGELDNRAVAPMPGVIDRVLVQEGDIVNEGDSLLVLMAMKMEYIIKAPRNCKVVKVPHQAGENVSKGSVLVEMEDIK
ncbi:methylcrotonoyl-CoA carboxylase subunit alpha, mitochondrial [Agrilus planipennis]|uniref:Methylcrotonoyl-CoA carboxylase subunit alpha, mitochondrial n=1 Tax=Agrilus planipennis TaxID=224129 RepID=A0A7F5RF19_AGRPL|nr:methylcrotonoyl-CoA carboxylase subunit alpha, mitochondrial [Agrilus planipennis]